MIEDTLCPECQKKMISRTGQYGRFWGCSDYPTCKGTRDSNGRSKAEREEYKRKREEHEDIGPDPLVRRENKRLTVE